MTCLEADPFVSTLYDGESVPLQAVQHVAECARCQGILQNYSEFGVQMRLAAALQTTDLPKLQFNGSRRSLHFLAKRIPVPRFVLAGLIATLTIATIATSLVLAESKPLWFQFAVGLQEPSKLDNYNVAQTGYTQSFGQMAVVDGHTVSVKLRVHVVSVSMRDVILQIRAQHSELRPSGSGSGMIQNDLKVSLDGAPTYHYKPGQTLAIPIEDGRGTMFVKGQVLDQQPQIAFGSPLRPLAHQMIVRWPVLTSENRIIGDMRGASSSLDNDTTEISFRCGPDGIFAFALQPFPRAVKAEANWGEITFKVDGKEYRLLAAAPITGGDQPQTVWVRHDASFNNDKLYHSLGVDPLGK